MAASAGITGLYEMLIVIYTIDDVPYEKPKRDKMNGKDKKREKICGNSGKLGVRNGREYVSTMTNSLEEIADALITFSDLNPTVIGIWNHDGSPHGYQYEIDSETGDKTLERIIDSETESPMLIPYPYQEVIHLESLPDKRTWNDKDKKFDLSRHGSPVEVHSFLCCGVKVFI